MSTSLGTYSPYHSEPPVSAEPFWPRITSSYHTAPVERAISISDIFCFLMPLLQVIRFDVVGEMCASDLLVLAVFPVAIMRHPERLRIKPLPAILGLGVSWMAAQIVTDVVRGTVPLDYLRGWSKIFLLMANIVVVWVVACRSQRRFTLYATGLAIGSILAFFAYPSKDAALAPWKFALGVPATILVMMWFPKLFRRPYLGILLPTLGLAVFDSFEDCRSLAVLTFISAVYALRQTAAARSGRARRPLQMLALAGSVLFAVFGFMTIYSHYAEKGLFGDYAQRKLAVQKAGTGGLLLGGRSEILGSGQAILDSPIIGHGSWARDPKYGDIEAQRRADLGYQDVDGPGERRDDLIPTHSFVFGAWVDAGVVGAVFWIYMIWFTIRTLLHVSGNEPMLPLFAFGGFLLLWDIFFSPLGMPTRFISPFFMAAMFALSNLRDAGEMAA